MDSHSGILNMSTDGICEIHYETQECKCWYLWLWRTYNWAEGKTWINILKQYEKSPKEQKYYVL